MKDINFLFSETITNKMEDSEKKKSGVSAGAIIIGILAASICIASLVAPGVYVAGLEKQISRAEQSLYDVKYNELRSVKARLESIKSSVNNKKKIINDIDQKSMASSQVLLMLEQAVPAGCYFSSVSYSGKSLNISGKADNSLIMAELMSNLDRLHTLSRGTNSVSLKQTQSPLNFNMEYAVSEKGGN